MNKPAIITDEVDWRVSAIFATRREVFRITIAPIATPEAKILLQLCSTMLIATRFIREHYPNWSIMPCQSTDANDIGLAYRYRGTIIRIEKIQVSHQIAMWLEGSEHYISPLTGVAAL